MAAKTERLMNLFIMLLSQRQFVPKSRIRDVIYAGDGDEAFEKKFERDKEELRELGVPLELGSHDPLFGDEVGYRVLPEAVSLPDITLSADEAAVLALAGRTWSSARLAEATGNAADRLSAEAGPIEATPLEWTGDQVQDEPGFEEFWLATLERREVSFRYRRAGSLEAEERLLQPWGLVRFSGRWYVVGFDVDREAERIFRLSRVVGALDVDPRPDLYTIPTGTDIRAIAERLVPGGPEIHAEVWLRRGRGRALRRQALSSVAISRSESATESAGQAPSESRYQAPPGDWDLVRVAGDLRTLSAEILTLGPDALVHSPPELRDVIVGRLQQCLNLHQGER